MVAFAQAFTDTTNSMNITWDILLVVIFIIGSLIYAFLIGKKQIVTMLVSIYMALAITVFFPYYSSIAAKTSISIPILQISIFAGITIISSLLFIRSKFRYLLDKHEKMNIVPRLIMSVIQVGLLIVIIVFFLPESFSAGLRTWTQYIFVTPTARFLWITLPMISLVLLKNKN